MTGHQCPHPECERLCPTEMFACRAHWYSLPAPMRARVWRAYRAGDLDATLELYAEAGRFWRGES